MIIMMKIKDNQMIVVMIVVYAWVKKKIKIVKNKFLISTPWFPVFNFVDVLDSRLV